MQSRTRAALLDGDEDHPGHTWGISKFRVGPSPQEPCDELDHGSPFTSHCSLSRAEQGPWPPLADQSLVGVSALLPALIRTILGMQRMPLLGRGPMGVSPILRVKLLNFGHFF